MAGGVNSSLDGGYGGGVGMMVGLGGGGAGIEALYNSGSTTRPPIHAYGHHQQQQPQLQLQHEQHYPQQSRDRTSLGPPDDPEALIPPALWGRNHRYPWLKMRELSPSPQTAAGVRPPDATAAVPESQPPVVVETQLTKRLSAAMNAALPFERLPDPPKPAQGSATPRATPLGGFAAATKSAMMSGIPAAARGAVAVTADGRGRSVSVTSSKGRAVVPPSMYPGGVYASEWGEYEACYAQPSGALRRRLEVAAQQRRLEVMRRNTTRLHRPTVAGPRVDMFEPRIQEPLVGDEGQEPPTPKTPTRGDRGGTPSRSQTPGRQRERIPLAALTRQHMEQERQRAAFNSEMRRRGADAAKRMVHAASRPGVPSLRGTDHTYLSPGARWFTSPSPRMGVPCRITITSNDLCQTPGPGAYQLPSAFLDR
jgi:hypothetical protein